MHAETMTVSRRGTTRVLSTLPGEGRVVSVVAAVRIPGETKGAHVWTMHDGKCVRLVVWADRDKAFASIGLDARSYPR